MRWIRDDEFIRGSIPMSKFDIRAVAVAMLEIGEGDIFLDVGAGTGSISVQAALMGAEVYAIERESEGVRLIRENAVKFGVEINILQGIAPAAIGSINSFNKCFIGGSGGNLVQIAEEIDRRLPSGGVLASGFIIPDNMVELKRLLKEKNYTGIEVRLIQTSVIEGMGLIRANNPIFLVKGIKQ